MTYSRKFTNYSDLACLAECGYRDTLTSKMRYVVLTQDLTLDVPEGFEPQYKRYFKNKHSADQYCFLQMLKYGSAVVVDLADPKLYDSMWQIIKLDSILQ